MEGDVAGAEVYHGLQTVAAAQQGEDMQGDPRQPCTDTGELELFGQLHDGRIAADRRHRAFVVVLELLQRLAELEVNDLTSNALASLDGGLGELGLGILGVDGTVADSKDAILAFDEEGAVGSNAAKIGRASCRERV